MAESPTDPRAPERKPDGYLAVRLRGLMNVGAGNVFASTVIAGLLLGYGVDYWLGSAPVAMLIGGFLGFVGGMRNAHRLMQAQQHDPNG